MDCLSGLRREPLRLVSIAFLSFFYESLGIMVLVPSRALWIMPGAAGTEWN